MVDRQKLLTVCGEVVKPDVLSSGSHYYTKEALEQAVRVFQQGAAEGREIPVHKNYDIDKCQGVVKDISISEDATVSATVDVLDTDCGKEVAALAREADEKLKLAWAVRGSYHTESVQVVDAVHEISEFTFTRDHSMDSDINPVKIVDEESESC